MSAGRSCPLHYRYRPDVFVAHEPLRAETVYVIGGLYGNVESLHRILEMKRDEEQASGRPVRLLFNGDFNWFDCDAQSFREINETVLEHAALSGNVEAELDSDDPENGCGCAYPEYVEQAVVDRSNAIMQRLHECAAAFPELLRRIAALPMHCSALVGGQRIGIVHGDPESLSGWSFAHETMPAGGDGVPASGEPAHRTSPERIAGYFRQAGVSAFASTHTCLPFVQDFEVDGTRRVLINNGAAGMPNFKAATYGLLTRISSLPDAPADSLYGTTLAATRFDALPIRYDQQRWLERFWRNWPEGSPGRIAYFKRITEGPDFAVQQAIRLRTRERAAG